MNIRLVWRETAGPAQFLPERKDLPPHGQMRSVPSPSLTTQRNCAAGAVASRQILLGRAGAQDPEHTIQHLAGIAPASATTVRPLPLIPLHERSNVLPLRGTQISHALGLLQLSPQSKGLSF